MRHINDLSDAALDRPALLTIGVFDGVHRGHQHLIRQLVQQAHASGHAAVVLTFFPHPDVVLRKLEGRYYLTSPDQRAELLHKLGIDLVVTLPFDAALRQMRASAFVDRLVEHLRLAELWVGADFALGYKREGNVAFLREQGKVRGFTVHEVELLAADGERISSSYIRSLLEAGAMEQVREQLGRGYALCGEVIHGKKRGRAIGFPTANIDVWAEQVIPANGVYAGWAYLGSGATRERYMAMTNVGISPTFMNKDITVEAYLLDFDREIYGETLTVTFEKYLRPEAKYDSLDALIDQIQEDVRAGREFLLTLPEA